MKSITVKKVRFVTLDKMRVLGTSGFALIELLVVVGIMGIFMAAVFSLYQTHQRSAYTQEETVEVQQNLRVGMDLITDDFRLAGLLVLAGTNPLAAFTDGATDTITLNTASASVAVTRLTSPTQSQTLAAGQSLNLMVNSVDAFAVGDVAMIVGAQDSNLVIPDTFDVTAVETTGTCAVGVNAPCLTLRAVSGGTGTTNPGDMVVRTGAGPYPNAITYSVVAGGGCPVGQTCLQRATNDGVPAQIIANNITNLQFMYVLQNGTEVAAPTDLSQVRAIRITLTGQRTNTVAYTGGAANTAPRTIVSVASIRNLKSI
ncbi:MAG: prepilin-type N-terminal cleavage/methylation domain-containing protein [Nitrospira sp.]|nr:prepilin-type N-terminal cleavage/methylation domain-containing protein [Nitrospira sp.]